ncbi:MAG: homoserine acetyltransferase, partial [Frankiales bacterium]|nr:homoserine acetyltransferase [Frankiales bacterium]
FYREELDRIALGHRDLETFLHAEWETAFAHQRAADLYAQLVTWSAADISGGGDLPATLAGIRARVLLMPSETDLYFRVADNAAELPHQRSAEQRPTPSVWGPRAGSPPGNPADLAFLRDNVREWLES